MKKLAAYLLPVFFLATVQFAFAQGLVNCGETTPCKIGDLGVVIKKALYFLLTISILITTVMIMVTGIKFMSGKDKAAELNEAKSRLVNIVIGVALITAAASVTFYVAFLSNIGVKNDFLKIFDIFKGTSFNFVESAYAAGETASKLPNPTNVTNLYEFLLKIITLVVRWFVYPFVIFSWFVTGFLFVRAQGNPERLNEAKRWLLWVFIGTLIVLMAQGFAYALRDTINQIFTS